MDGGVVTSKPAPPIVSVKRMRTSDQRAYFG